MKNNKELIIAIAVFILFIFVSVFVLGFKQPFNTQLPPDQSTTQLSPKPSETPLGTAIKNSDKISQNDFKIRSELISKTSGGYIYLSKNFHIVYLENEGIYTSTGSACSSHTGAKSHVLKAIGRSDKEIASSIRISISKYTTKEELDFVLEQLEKIMKKLRKWSF